MGEEGRDAASGVLAGLVVVQIRRRKVVFIIAAAIKRLVTCIPALLCSTYLPVCLEYPIKLTVDEPIECG